MSTPDGGCAFPVSYAQDLNGNVIQYPEVGMTLRDYFAAKAMAVFIALDNTATLADDARAAYKVADAMLAERAK